MKTLAVCAMACLMILASGGTSQADSDRHRIQYDRDCILNDVDFDLDDGNILFTHNGRDKETVEITEDYDLYINDQRVMLDDSQRELVAEFHGEVIDLVEYAKEIGWEGAKIGADGASLGLKAIGGLFKVVFTSYDTEDFERDIEREAEKLEAKAEVLERKAERIEGMADDVEDLVYDLRRAIPELDELDWF